MDAIASPIPEQRSRFALLIDHPRSKDRIRVENGGRPPQAIEGLETCLPYEHIAITTKSETRSSVYVTTGTEKQIVLHLSDLPQQYSTART